MGVQDRWQAGGSCHPAFFMHKYGASSFQRDTFPARLTHTEWGKHFPQQSDQKKLEAKEEEGYWAEEAFYH